MLLSRLSLESAISRGRNPSENWGGETFMVKVALIGLGNMGRLHLVNCLKMDDVDVVAVADPSKRALKRAGNLGVNRLYVDYKELLNHPRDLDAVVISVPNFLHFETIQSFLENGVNVFTEKPMAITVQQCEEIVKSARNSSRKVMIGHCMRFVDAIEKMKATLDRGCIGSLEVATIEEVVNGPFSHPAVPKPVADWWFDPKKSGGGVLMDIGYHMIDLFRFFAQEDSKVMFSSLSYKFNLPVEEGAIVLLSTVKSSIKGTINVGWYQRTVFPKYNFRVILHGNSGYLSSDELVPKNLYTHAAKEGLKNIARRLTGRKIRPLSYTYYYEAFYRELQIFFDCVKNDLEPPVSALDGLKTVQLIEEAYALFKNRGANEHGK